MGKVRVLSNKSFNITIMETNNIIPVGISIMDEEQAKKYLDIVRILDRVEEIKEEEIIEETIPPIGESENKTNEEQPIVNNPDEGSMKDTNPGQAYKF